MAAKEYDAVIDGRPVQEDVADRIAQGRLTVVIVEAIDSIDGARLGREMGRDSRLVSVLRFW